MVDDYAALVGFSRSAGRGSRSSGRSTPLRSRPRRRTRARTHPASRRHRDRARRFRTCRARGSGTRNCIFRVRLLLLLSPFTSWEGTLTDGRNLFCHRLLCRAVRGRPRLHPVLLHPGSRHARPERPARAVLAAGHVAAVRARAPPDTGRPPDASGALGRISRGDRRGSEHLPVRESHGQGVEDARQRERDRRGRSAGCGQDDARWERQREWRWIARWRTGEEWVV